MHTSKVYPSLIISSIVAIVLGIFIYTSLAASAQELPAPGSGQALEISPALVTMDVDPGETTTLEIRLRNVSNEDLIVSGEINDFVAGDELGSPRVIIEEDEEVEPEDNPYSLKEWVDPLPQLLLEPNEIETMTTTITVPADASPGGHYGVVRFSGTPPELEGTGVSLAASVGTLMLLSVDGDIEEGAAVEEFSVMNDGEVGTVFESAPLQLMQRIRNTGNVHVQVSGQAIIKDMFGRNVASANVNLPRHNILPESIRRFEQDVDESLIGDRRLFGRYTVDLELTYGEDGTLTDTLAFWVIPYRLIGVVLALFVIGFFLVRHLLKRYRKRILSQAHRYR